MDMFLDTPNNLDSPTPVKLSIQEAKDRLSDILYGFENLDEDTHPLEFKVIGLKKSNHQYLIWGLLGFALNHEDFTLVDTTVYCPYAIETLKRFLKRIQAPGSRDSENLRMKMKQIAYNWQGFIWEACDEEIPSELLTKWKENQRDRNYRITIYAIDLRYTFSQILAAATEKASNSKERGITIPAKTKGPCITANDGEDVSKRVHSQHDPELRNWQERIRNAVEMKATEMVRDHRVVILDNLIGDYLLKDPNTRWYLVQLKEGHRRTTVQGFLPGVIEKLGLELSRVSDKWEEIYPYLKGKKRRSHFYHPRQ